MTSNNAPGQRPRMMAAVVLVAAAATVAGLVGAVAPANAADQYIALSIGLLNDNPPVRTVGGSAIGPNENQAATASLTNCVNNGGGHCVNQVIANNACASRVERLRGNDRGV